MPLARKAPPSLRARALAWLALREHTRQELRARLRRWVAARDGDDGLADESRDPPAAALASADAIEPLLDALEKEGLLSDRRFVESRVHARASRFGNRRIEMELRQHGVRADDDTLARLKATEVERARAVWMSRFGQVPAGPAERARQMRFLAGRGFSSETIRRVLAQGPGDE